MGAGLSNDYRTYIKCIQLIYKQYIIGINNRELATHYSFCNNEVYNACNERSTNMGNRICNVPTTYTYMKMSHLGFIKENRTLIYIGDE